MRLRPAAARDRAFRQRPVIVRMVSSPCDPVVYGIDAKGEKDEVYLDPINGNVVANED